MSSSLALQRFEGITHVLIDCDDCVYQNNWATARRITESIAAYTSKLGVSKDKAYALYQQHGTCLKGLLLEGLIDEAGVEQFLHEVHAIEYSDIAPDPRLRSVLEGVFRLVPCWIFTASAREHAKRCLTAVGIDGLPWQGVIDTRDCKLETKHSPASFAAALRIAGATDPSSCLLCDDSVKNIVAAKAFGLKTVLVGMYDRDSGAKIECEAADVHVASLHDLGPLMGVLSAS